MNKVQETAKKSKSELLEIAMGGLADIEGLITSFVEARGITSDDFTVLNIALDKIDETWTRIHDCHTEIEGGAS